VVGVLEWVVKYRVGKRKWESRKEVDI